MAAKRAPTTRRPTGPARVHRVRDRVAARASSLAPLEVVTRAKVNLSLQVIRRRPDGYHEVETILQSIDLADRMRVELTGSVAFKLALIAAGRGDGTFSLTPKHEWDVCSGAALIAEGGGRITDCDGQPLRFNREKPLLPGIIATNGPLFDPIRAAIAESRA